MNSARKRSAFAGAALAASLIVQLALAPACAQRPAPQAPRPALVLALEEAEEAMAVGELAEARAAFEEALVLDVRSEAARLGLARLSLLEGDARGALVILSHLADGPEAAVSPRALPVYCPASGQSVRQFIEDGQTELALRVARARAEAAHCPADGEALESLALAAYAESQLGAGELGSAADSFRELASRHPEQAHAFSRAASLFLGIGDRSHSLELLSEGLRHHPDDRALRSLMLRALGVPGALPASGTRNDSSVPPAP